MFSVEFSADLVQIQVRETVCGVFFGTNGHPNLSLRNANDGGIGRACGNELPQNS